MNNRLAEGGRGRYGGRLPVQGWAAGAAMTLDPDQSGRLRRVYTEVHRIKRRNDMARRLLTIIVLLAAFAGAAHAASGEIVTRAAKGKFEDVKERVMEALESRGLVLNYTARIGDMLARTGKDLGRTRQIYAQAELLEFCSAILSRDTMEADPHNIVFCPYGIAIYTLPKEPGRVYVSYRKSPAHGSPQSVKTLQAVEKLLADVVAEALR
jgi:uncharacterized protein (DUF302 family)